MNSALHGGLFEKNQGKVKSKNKHGKISKKITIILIKFELNPDAAFASMRLFESIGFIIGRVRSC